MRWEITVDHAFDSELDAKSAVGTEGPSSLTPGQEMPYKFRMYDDDGGLYYEGVCSEESFDPLDDFGMPNAGCTEIRYRKITWEQL